MSEMKLLLFLGYFGINFISCRPTIVPMSIYSQRRTKLGGSVGSVSSASGASPISSEGQAETFYNYGPMMIGGRSLDQLYKSSIDDEDSSNRDIKSQANFDYNVMEDLKLQLAHAEKEHQCTVDAYNR